MKRFLTVGLTVLLALASAEALAVDGQWAKYVYMQSVTSNTLGRLCTGMPNGFGRYFDIGCADNAPFVSSTSGYLGIGTVTPTTALEVAGTISTSSLVVNGVSITGTATTDRITSGTTNVTANTNGAISFTTAGSQRMVINGSGSVGIGTTTPNVPVTVEAATNQLNLRTTGSTWGLLMGSGNNYGPVANSAFVIGVNATPLVFGTNNSAKMTIDSSGNVGIGTTAPQATLQVSGSFTVSTSAQTTTPNLYVGTNGNVGVGTASPGQKLDVNGIIRASSHMYGDIAIFSGGFRTGSGNGDTYFYREAANSWQIGREAQAYSQDGKLTVPHLTVGASDTAGGSLTIAGGIGRGTGIGGSLLFQTAPSGSSGATENTLATRMIINGSGNVGIGTTAPSATLDVSGTFRMAGTGSESCGPSNYGTLRVNPVTRALEMCRE